MKTKETRRGNISRNSEAYAFSEGHLTRSGSMHAYQKAYLLQDLRKYGAWNEDEYQPSTDQADADSNPNLEDDTIVYLRDDYSVATDVFDESPAIFSNVTDEWKEFCSTDLSFSIPDE